MKTMWEKEKLFLTSNFSSSHIVFNPFGELSAILIKSEIVICKLFHFAKVWNWLFGKELSNLQHFFYHNVFKKCFPNSH